MGVAWLNLMTDRCTSIKRLYIVSYIILNYGAVRYGGTSKVLYHNVSKSDPTVWINLTSQSA